jgi:hypothetical protein
MISRVQPIEMDYKATIVLATWAAVAVIASVNMLVFGSQIGDIFFGVFLPVGFLVIVALIVTFSVLPHEESK